MFEFPLERIEDAVDSDGLAINDALRIPDLYFPPASAFKVSPVETHCLMLTLFNNVKNTQICGQELT